MILDNIFTVSFACEEEKLNGNLCRKVVSKELTDFVVASAMKMEATRKLKVKLDQSMQTRHEMISPVSWI